MNDVQTYFINILQKSENKPHTHTHTQSPFWTNYTLQSRPIVLAKPPFATNITTYNELEGGDLELVVVKLKYCFRVTRGEVGAVTEMAEAALSSERRDAFGEDGGRW